MGTKEDKLMLIEWLTKLEDKDTVERIKTIKSEYDTQKQPYFNQSGPLRIEESSNSLQNIVREEIVVYTRIKDGIKIWRY